MRDGTVVAVVEEVRGCEEAVMERTWLGGGLDLVRRDGREREVSGGFLGLGWRVGGGREEGIERSEKGMYLEMRSRTRYSWLMGSSTVPSPNSVCLRRKQ